MKIKIGTPWCFTEQGRKDNQEDYLWPMPECDDAAGRVLSGSPDSRVFLMCDGVGGRDSGEVASMTAANAIGDYITTHFDLNEVFTEEDFKTQALSSGYDALDKVGNDSLSKMATTMTCLVLHKGGALVAHIGDSRIYHVRPSEAVNKGGTGIIFQTTDHSLVQDLIRIGELTEEEAVNFPQKNVITRAMQPHLERRYKADTFNITDVKAGDYFFLCCDGVLEQLSNEMLGEILADKELDDKGKIEAIKAICDGKTRDNYTCWLVPVQEVVAEATDVLAKSDDLVASVVESEEGLDDKTPAQSAEEGRDKSSRKFTPAPEVAAPLPESGEEKAKRAHRSRIANVKIILGIVALIAVASLLGFYARDYFMQKSAEPGKAEKNEAFDIKQKKSDKSDEKDRKKDDGKGQFAPQNHKTEEAILEDIPGVVLDSDMSPEPNDNQSASPTRQEEKPRQDQSVGKEPESKQSGINGVVNSKKESRQRVRDTDTQGETGANNSSPEPSYPITSI